VTPDDRDPAEVGDETSRALVCARCGSRRLRATDQPAGQDVRILECAECGSRDLAPEAIS
jgi:hypothetical protein